MARESADSHTFTFEYRGAGNLSKDAFGQILTQIQRNAEDVSGFRIEVTSSSAFDISFDELANRQTTEQAPEGETEEEGERGTTAEADEPEEIPSLRSGALPSRVLSVMQERDEEPFRTSEIRDVIDEDDVDTARVSQTLASLKRRGLVDSETDPEDKRANIYRLSDRGRQALTHLEERTDGE